MLMIWVALMSEDIVRDMCWSGDMLAVRLFTFTYKLRAGIDRGVPSIYTMH